MASVLHGPSYVYLTYIVLYACILWKRRLNNWVNQHIQPLFVVINHKILLSPLRIWNGPVSSPTTPSIPNFDKEPTEGLTLYVQVNTISAQIRRDLERAIRVALTLSFQVGRDRDNGPTLGAWKYCKEVPVVRHLHSAPNVIDLSKYNYIKEHVLLLPICIYVQMYIPTSSYIRIKLWIELFG